MDDTMKEQWPKLADMVYKTYLTADLQNNFYLKVSSIDCLVFMTTMMAKEQFTEI